MRCPKCGDEVFEEAVYCHKCGARLDTYENSLSPPGGEEVEPVGGPIEQFKGAAAERREAAAEPEEELWQGGYATRAMVGAWIVTVLVTIGLFVVAIWAGWGATGWKIVLVLMLLVWLYQFVVLARRKLGVRYRLTSERFFHEVGILRHVTDRIEAIDMDDVAFEQTLLERLVGVGTIHITSSDRSHPELSIRGIENVKEVARMIDEARHKERIRRGLHIEAI